MVETTTQLQLLQKGGPFKLAEAPKPIPGPSEVLIRQRATAINLLEIKMRDLGLGVSRWPTVLGIEGAGVVEAVGSDVRGLQPGDETHVAVPAYLIAKKPENISLEEAASLPICFTTAVAGITRTLNIPLPFLRGVLTEGEVPGSVLVLGGSSATGAAAIQLLRKAYPSLPILATASKKHHARLTDLGATYVADYKTASIVADLKAASPRTAGVDVILDCVSAGASQTDICDVLDHSGSKRYAAVLTGVPVPVPEGVSLLEVNGWDAIIGQGGKEVIPSLTKLVEEGTYEVPLPVRVLGHGLGNLPDVLDEVKTVSGEKVVLTL